MKTNARVFDVWMKVAGGIGWVVTTLILGVIYFGVFTPVSIILRLMGKDFMTRKWGNSCESYWMPCKEKTVSRDRYLNQF